MSLMKDIDAKEKNIDRAIDMLLNIQKENGIQTNMREALFDPVTKERINKFQRARLEKDGVNLDSYRNSGCSGCGKCGSEKISNIQRGIFVYSEDDLEDAYEDSEEELPYICEHCIHIGYDETYKPEYCDVCDDCETCQEYIRGECDGCGFSRTYNGTSYGISKNQTGEENMTVEDSAIFEELRSDTPDSQIHFPDRKFSIMDY